MSASSNVVLLCILANLVLCDEDANKPQALPQTGLENMYNNLYGAQFTGGVNLPNTYGLNMNSAGLQLNTNGFNLNNGALNLNQANLNPAGYNLNQGGYLLNQQPQYAGYLNFNQQPQQNMAFSGLNLNTGLNLQSPNNGASYGNSYPGLSGTDLSSFLSTAVKNYNQQQAGIGVESTLTSQIKDLGTPGIDKTVQNSKIHNFNMGTVTPGSDLLRPQTFGSHEVSQGSNLYNPQSISLQGRQHQLNQHQYQPAPVEQFQSGQHAQFGSQTGFQPIHIGGINSPTSLNGNPDLKSLFNQYGSNHYGYGSAGLLDNKFKTGSIHFNEDGSSKYQLNTPNFGITENKKFQSDQNQATSHQSTGFPGFKNTAIDSTSNKFQLFTPAEGATQFGITGNKKFQADQNQATSQHSTDFARFKGTAIEPTSMKANSYSFDNLDTDSLRSYGQGSVQNAFKFNQIGPHQFKSDNVGASNFGGNTDIVYGGAYNFKPTNLELDAFESLQQAFKTEEPKHSFKSSPSSFHGYKTNEYKSDLPKRTVYKYNDVKPHISKKPNDFESNEYSKYNNRYTTNNVRQPKQNKDYESYEYEKPQFSQHSNKGTDGNNQNTYRGFLTKKPNNYSDFGRYAQNAYKGNNNNKQSTYERSEGKHNVGNSLNTGKKETGMIVHISVKNGDHGYTQSLRYP